MAEVNTTDNATGGAADKPAENSGGKTFTQTTGQIVFASEAEYQKDLEAKLKERLEREQAKAAKAAEKARAEAEAKALQEQGEFKKLAEKQAAELESYKAKAAELEGVSAEAKRLTNALIKYRDAQFTVIPEHIKPLLEKLDVVDQIEWLSANADKLRAAPDDKKPSGTPTSATRKPQKQPVKAQVFTL